MNILNPTVQNIVSQRQLFDDASIILGLFIGYLITGATKHKVEDYINIYVAYFCIQGRGIAVILGTSSMLITRIISINYNEIYAIDINPDNEINNQNHRNLIYRFLKNLEIIQTILHLISYCCFTIFILSFCLGLYSMFYHQLDFTLFIFVIILHWNCRANIFR